MIIVERGDPHDPQATALLQASHDLMEELFPPEDNHYLSIDALCVPEIEFLVARTNEKIIGTAAVANKGDYGEVKSMFVAPEARGTGAADALMRALEDRAKDQGLPELKLETGTLLKAAHKLYLRHGFEFCDRFGEYPDNETSVFMSKKLAK